LNNFSYDKAQEARTLTTDYLTYNLFQLNLPQNDNLNAEAVRRALRVIQAHRLLYAPSSTLQNLANGNTLDMCEFSAQDIKNADELYGPCIICSTVKGVRTAHSSIHKRARRVGEAIWINWFITPKKNAPGTLTLLDEYSGNAYLWEAESKYPMIVISLLRKLNAELKGYGQEQIVEVLADAGTELTSEDFHEGCKDMGIRVVNMPPGESAARIERTIQTLRNRVSVILTSLGYSLLITLMRYVHEFAVQVHNFLPSEQSGMTTSPYRIFTGAKVPWSNMSKLRFGQLAIAENVRFRGNYIDGAKVGYGEMVIVLSYDPNNLYSRRVYRLQTGSGQMNVLSARRLKPILFRSSHVPRGWRKDRLGNGVQTPGFVLEEQANQQLVEEARRDGKILVQTVVEASEIEQAKKFLSLAGESDDRDEDSIEKEPKPDVVIREPTKTSSGRLSRAPPRLIENDDFECNSTEVKEWMKEEEAMKPSDKVELIGAETNYKIPATVVGGPGQSVTVKKARSLLNPHRKHVDKALEDECDNFRSNECHQLVDSVPIGAILLTILVILANKYNADGSFNKTKARFVIDGSRQGEESYHLTFAPVATLVGERLVLTMACKQYASLWVFDIESFL